ncbi:MAG: LPS export ABC transporter periplasmic protein LptC [Nitrospinae bacterium]|nr:LPS export ABC transporter periplasmic protein LptC [Nitrospinota bacterium]
MLANKIRKILLGLILLLLAVSAFNLIKLLNKEALPIETLKAMSKNVDIEIKNFEVTHETLGRKDWEIKAKSAQIKNKENTIILTDVNVILNADQDRRSTISADSGTINQETNDIQLEGNVKFKADADSFFDRFQKPDGPTQKTDNP